MQICIFQKMTINYKISPEPDFQSNPFPSVRSIVWRASVRWRDLQLGGEGEWKVGG